MKKYLNSVVSLVLTTVLVGMSAFAAWGEASNQDYVGAANWIIFGAATALANVGLYQKTQTKTSIVVYISAYTLSLAAFLGIILRQTNLPELWLYTGLLGAWSVLTASLAHAAFRAKPPAESSSPNLTAS
jgi:hypothetical protein